MTLDAAITKLSAHSDLDGRGKDILAAATTLRDLRRHARVNALRLMCTLWGVGRREKIYGKSKEPSLATIACELGKTVCLAAAQWRPKPDGQTEQRGVPEHASSEAAQRDAPKDGEGSEQRGVAEHASANSSSVAAPDEISGAGNPD